MFQIIHERPQDAEKIEPLLEICFGPERFSKTAYKIRQSLSPIAELSLAAIDGDELVGTVRYWEITIGGKTPALLLGPIAVLPTRRGENIGVDLVRKSLQHAKQLGHQIVVLVGDPEYYERFGFYGADDKGLELPGPVEKHRFLVHELTPNALAGVTGMVVGAEKVS